MIEMLTLFVGLVLLVTKYQVYEFIDTLTI